MVDLNLNFLKKKEEESKPKPKCSEPEAFEIKSSKELTSLVINCEGCSYNSSIEDPECREQIIDKLIENPVDKIILDLDFYKKEYSIDQTSMLCDAARASDRIKIRGIELRKECGSCGEKKKEYTDVLKYFIKIVTRGL